MDKEEYTMTVLNKFNFDGEEDLDKKELQSYFTYLIELDNPQKVVDDLWEYVNQDHDSEVTK